MEVVQYIGGIASVLWGIASVLWGDSFSTVEVAQYSEGIASVLWGIASVLWRDTFSTVEGYLQYCGGDTFSTVEGIPSVLWRGYLQYCGGITAVHVGDSFSTVGDTFSTVEVVEYSGGITSVQWGIASVLWRLFCTLGDSISTWGDNISTVGDNISTVGDNISTVEGIQYSGGRILILACLVINSDEKISTFFVLRYEIFIWKFSKIQADFMPFESWTGVLQVPWAAELGGCSAPSFCQIFAKSPFFASILAFLCLQPPHVPVSPRTLKFTPPSLGPTLFRNN